MINSKRIYIIPVIGFLLIIVIASVILYMPICNNKPINFLDSLFVTISGVSTTGLTTVTIVEQFNFLGQLIIAILMEIGAYGFIVIISYIWSLQKKKISMSDMILINDNISSNDFNLIKEHLLFIGKYMLGIQGYGAIFYSIRFIKLYGFLEGIWKSIFSSISAFSNAGFDVIMPNGFIYFKDDIYVQIVTIILMFLGSIGILVIEDIRKNKAKKFNRLRLQSQIVLASSIFVIILPAVILFILESNIGIINSLFTSITTRSTGSTVVEISSLSLISKYIIMLLMLIGGGPASTSGGIRILPFAIATVTVWSTLRGKDRTIIFNRKIPDFIVRKAFTIIIVFIIILFISGMIFYFLNNIGVLNIAFESISAVTNTGLSITDYNNLNVMGELILIMLMFTGRIGPLSMILIFIRDDDKYKLIEYPEGNIIV